MRGATPLIQPGATLASADMQTPEFDHTVKELIRLAQDRRTVIMCAEAVPWRCHRSLIADALLVRGLDAEEITSETRTHRHTLTPWSCVSGQRITYPRADSPEATDKTPLASGKASSDSAR